MKKISWIHKKYIYFNIYVFSKGDILISLFFCFLFFFFTVLVLKDTELLRINFSMRKKNEVPSNLFFSLRAITANWIYNFDRNYEHTIVNEISKYSQSTEYVIQWMKKGKERFKTESFTVLRVW